MPQRIPTRLLALCAAALLLSACDAGHRGDPGGDNRWPGPELAIQLPGPGATLAYEVDEDGWAAYQAGTGKPIQAMLQLRALQKTNEVVVRYAVDDQPFRALEDPTRPFALPAGLTPGTHLLSAYVSDRAGQPVFGAHSATVASFHVRVAVTRKDGSVDVLGGPSNTYGHRVGGIYHPFDRRAPQLVVDRRGARVHVMAVNAKLAPDALRIRWGDEHVQTGYGTTVTLEDAGSSITLTLERKQGEDWVGLPGARAAWPMIRP